MKKRIVSLLLFIIITTLLCGCVSREDYNAMAEAVDNTNQYDLYRAGFYFSITSIKSDTTIMYAQGALNIDKRNGFMMNGAMSQYIFGESSTAEVAFNDGKYFDAIKSESENKKTYSEMNSSVLLRQFLFADAQKFDLSKIKSLKKEDKDGKTIYSFIVKADPELFNSLLGEDIYTLAGATTPDTKRTVYSDAECTYYVNNDGTPLLSSININFNVTLYNKMPYLPGTKLDEAKYRFDLTATMKLTYQQLGDGVSVAIPDISEYTAEDAVTSETSDDESESSVVSSDTESNISSTISAVESETSLR